MQPRFISRRFFSLVSLGLVCFSGVRLLLSQRKLVAIRASVQIDWMPCRMKEGDIDGHATTSNINISTSFLSSFKGTTDGDVTTKVVDRATRSKTGSDAQKNDRICTSPEYHVSWPLNGSTPSLTAPSFSCGTSSYSPLSSYFLQLLTKLEKKYSKTCKQAIRFGVALGSQHVSYLRPTSMSSRPCAIIFVLEDEMPTSSGDNDKKKRRSYGRENLVGIPRYALPYKSMRRNAKLFKLHGHLLFPWTKAVVWQDVKLKSIPSRPAKIYTKRLLSSKNDSNKPCLVAMGLPRHYNAFGDDALVNGYQPKYNDHCNAVVNAMIARPNVTDSADTLQHQCRFYQETAASIDSNDIVPLHRGLIDSAFLVWNQGTKKCRDFNERLACSWSSEIQCFSDRDQVSFPFVLQQMGLQESSVSKGKDGVSDSLSLVDKDGDLMVRILGSHCHWYTGKFPVGCF